MCVESVIADVSARASVVNPATANVLTLIVKMPALLLETRQEKWTGPEPFNLIREFVEPTLDASTLQGFRHDPSALVADIPVTFRTPAAIPSALRLENDGELAVCTDDHGALIHFALRDGGRIEAL
jgi:hypothetical protein